MAAVSNSVVHLTMRFGKTVLSYGTGFIYQQNSEFYIVTAWHNLSGRHSETLKTLSDNLSIPDNVVVNLTFKVSENMTIRLSMVLPLVDQEKSLFYIHPENWPRIDVAVIQFNPNSEFLSEMHLSTGEYREVMVSPPIDVYGTGNTEVYPIQKYLVPDNGVIDKWFQSVEVTEELFIPSYPHNIKDYYAQPVWKRATIASSVQHGWNNEPKFLIDSASKSGMSGAPVLYYSPNGSVQILGSKYHFMQDVAILAGIYVGRMGVKGELDPQIGTVWHRSVIDEITAAKCNENLPFEIELSSTALIDNMQDILAPCSQEELSNIMNPALPSRHYVQLNLIKKINGRASPDNALAAVIEAANSYGGPLAEDNNAISQRGKAQ